MLIGWHLSQELPAEVARSLLAEVAEQVEEFSRRGYGLILVGERDGLAEALTNVGVAVPDRITPSTRPNSASSWRTSRYRRP